MLQVNSKLPESGNYCSEKEAKEGEAGGVDVSKLINVNAEEDRASGGERVLNGGETV